ncbi:hypothetical protein FPOA_12324 [Fusarium poae]|uniref:Uncharacterized protein n=1 Tax=Fusarium poae TaxID=36050 RepID=A0A1B8A9H6_FUSPO|nr:hypothetical protein FPOA_12324 [Fusarium poae]
MKGSRDSMGNQEDSYAKKKGRSDAPIPFVHLPGNEIGTGSAGFATSMHTQHKNKRNIEEMSGQPEPDSGRPAKRMDHGHGDGVMPATSDDHMMPDEEVEHTPPKKKRYIEEMSGQPELDSGRPAKRMDYGDGVMPATRDDHMMPNEEVEYTQHKNKRNIEEMSGQSVLDSGRPTKRMYHGYNGMQAISDDYMMRDEAQPKQGLDGEISGYAERVRNYELLLESNIDEKVFNGFQEAFRRGSTTLAKVIHDSPQRIRLWVLGMMDTEFRRTIIDLMSDMETKIGDYDPVGALPNIMTDSLAREPFGKLKTCVVCEGGFCSANKESPVDVEEVVWKDCRIHLMHLECFRKKVSKGEVPVKGFCECVNFS